jgi:hypothetical protein
MPRQSRRKHAAAETGKLIAAGVLGLVTLIGAGWGIHLWATTPAPVQRDKVTLCPPGQPQDVIVIVMDTTDRLADASRAEAKQLLIDMIEQSPQNALLDLRVIDPSHNGGRTVLTLCNPGDGRGLSEFTGNPEMAKRTWQQRFREPLIQAIDGNLNPTPSKISPLLTTFQGIALERFTGARAATARKQLVIVSDMIEHVPGEYTQYPPADLRYERFKSLPVYRKVHTDLKGAEVSIFYVQRLLPRPIDTGAHIRFWIDWIADNNGRLNTKDTIKLQGAAKS